MLKIRKKSHGEWLALFAFTMPFLFFFLIDFLGLPSLVKYTVDVAWLALFVMILWNRNQTWNSGTKPLIWIIVLFFTATLVGLIFHYQSPIYYLWGLRNNARFFVYFFACIAFINKSSIEYYLRFFDIVFWINVPVVLYQILVLKKRWDYLGGLFGTGLGCNAYINVFFVIVVAKSLIYYLNGKERMLSCLLKCSVALAIAAVSELKAFIIEFVLIVVIALLITKFSFRKIVVVIGGTVVTLVAIEILALLFPSFADWFNFESILETASSNDGYTMRGDMNRLTAVSISVQRFLPSWVDKLFGLGLGNCDYSSSFAFLTSPFYQMYGGLNYVWFSSAFLVLETGIVGLILYVSFFVAIYFCATKRQKSGKGELVHCQIARVLAFICIFLIIYNASMRTEAAYMMFFVLALPFIDGNKAETLLE